MRGYMEVMFFIIMLVGSANADTTSSQIISIPAYEGEKVSTKIYPAVSITGQHGSINVPSAFIQKGIASIGIYNTYTYQDNMLGTGNKFKNDTVFGAFSYAPFHYLEVSIGSIESLSSINSSQSIRYSGDLRIGIKVGQKILPCLGIAGLGEILTYSKSGSSGYAGYNGDATSYTLSLLMSYNMFDSALSFPMITNLRVGYFWDNSEKLISSNENNFMPPIGKYAMGIRGDNLTLLALSILFPLPEYYIEPMLEFTSQFSNKYSSYDITEPSYNNISFNQNPVYFCCTEFSLRHAILCSETGI